MDPNLKAVFISSVILITIPVVITIISNYHLKRKLIDSGAADENTLKIVTRSFSQFRVSALKWALVLFFGGVGLMTLEFIPYSFITSPFPYGYMGCLLAIALFIYYFLLKKEKTD